MPDITWTRSAKCQDTDPELFYPRIGGRNAQDEAEAKKVCRGCPVARQCLELAMKNEATVGIFYRFGIFGGLNPKERVRLARGRRAQQQSQGAA